MLVKKTKPRRKRTQNNKLSFARELKPRQIRTNITMRHRFRFQYAGTDGVIISITNQSLLAAAGVVVRAQGAPGTVDLIYSAVKVHEVEVWAPALASGSSLTLNWAGPTAAFSVPMEVGDTTLSQAYPAHIRTRPPHLSTCEFWNYVRGPLTIPSSAITLFTVQCPQDSIMDIEGSWIQNDGDGVLSDAIAVATTPVGSVVHLTADDFTTTGDWTPVGINFPV